MTLRSGTCSPTASGPACFPGNVIPPDRINPLGRAILNLLPTSNSFDVSVSNREYNYADTDIPDLYRTLQQVTLDHNFTDNDRVSAKYRHWRPNREATSGTFGINSNWNHFFENTGTGTAWKMHVIADLNLGGHEPVAGDVTGDGCVDIVTKPWRPSPNNAVSGSPYVLFMHNVSAGCK